MAKKFRHPSDMPKNEKRGPLSTRVKLSTLDYLKTLAKAENLALGEIVANTLDDYVLWLKEQEARKKRGKK